MVICLDYGHRNTKFDHGASNGQHKESYIAYQIGEKLRKQLEKNVYKVILTRKDESQIISLNDRCRVANSNGVDLFISIHINAAENVSASGIEVLHYAGKENEVFSKKICDAMCEATGARNRGARVRNDLAVLNGTKCKAVLIECGFISNEDELNKLINESYQVKIVKGILKGLGVEYKEEVTEKEVFYRVVCGSFKDRNEAEKRLRDITEKGFKDSFIVAYEK